MNKVTILALIALVILVFAGMWSSRYQKGYDDGYSQVPPNVLPLDGIAIEREGDYIFFTVTSGNTTKTAISVADVADNKTEFEPCYFPGSLIDGLSTR